MPFPLFDSPRCGRIARRCLVLAVMALPFLAVHAQTWTPGQNYFGRNNYVEYRPGDLPIIIITGHGGSLIPSEIPDRANGTYNGVTYTDIVTVSDTNTRQLAEALVHTIFTRTGRRPHLIISHLHRRKLDPNRTIGEAALGNAFAEQAWQEFHDYIRVARGLAETQFGFGFVADIHGHAHTIQRVELGYNFGGADLRQSDTTLNYPGYAWMSYFRTLALHRPGVPFHTLLRGPASFGDLLNRTGSQKAWPSPDFPAPSTSDLFFAGGYNTDTHTCRLDNALIGGIQFECHYNGLRDTAPNREAFAAQFADTLQVFLYNHYGYHLGTRSLFTLQPPATTTLTRGGAPLTLTIARTGSSTYALTLPLAFSGTAIAGVDYIASATSLSFANGQTSRTITITPAAAAGALGDKTIVVRLAPPVTEAADTSPLTLTLGDNVSHTVRVQALDAAVTEAAGVARFRVHRTQTNTALTVPLSWSGTALAQADYFDAPAYAQFAAGASSVDVAVPLVDDGRAEPDKTLTLSLDTAASHTIGFPGSATITLRDDDRPVGLLAWLRGDMANNVVFDSSGADRHATSLPADSALTRGPSALTLAGDLPAINFDGTNDTLALPRFVADPQGAFTVSFFFRLQPHTVAAADQSLLSYGARGQSGSLHVFLNGTTNVALRTQLPSLASNALDLTGINWQDNTWRHYTLTVSAEGTCRVYVHDLAGNLLTQRTAFGRTGRLAANELFWLGWRPQERTAGGYLRGAMRDFRIYDRAIEVVESSALARGTLSYAAWLAQNGLASTHAPSADDDGDGYAALLEYALAARITAADAAPRYTVAVENQRLTLRFLRETTASDLTWFIEASADLNTWQTLARRTATAAQWTIVTAGATVSEINGFVTATDSAPATPARFLRLRVER